VRRVKSGLAVSNAVGREDCQVERNVEVGTELLRDERLRIPYHRITLSLFREYAAVSHAGWEDTFDERVREDSQNCVYAFAPIFL